jgi:arylformamidase
MRRIDLSMPLRPGMPAFPDDPPFGVGPFRSLRAGDRYNLSRIMLGTHTGTHVDPPRHFLPEGMPVDRLDLGILNGPCLVVDLASGVDAIGPEAIPALPPETPRVLFRTRNSTRWARGESFYPDYVALTLGGAEELLRRGVQLVGIDSLSIESDPSETYPVHHALLGHGVVILEGLLLEDAPAGRHLLECLPLRVHEGDGGPARAVLVVD